jgi:hypothetical protein
MQCTSERYFKIQNSQFTIPPKEATVDEQRERGVTDPVSGNDTRPRREGLSPDMQVREEDLEPHAGLRYIARLFKVLAILLLLLLLAEIIIGIVAEGGAAIPTLMVEATRLIVFAGLLWGLGDMALMLIESNHDLRATRILVGRLNGRMTHLTESIDHLTGRHTPPAPPGRGAAPQRADRPPPA